MATETQIDSGFYWTQDGLTTFYASEHLPKLKAGGFWDGSRFVPVEVVTDSQGIREWAHMLEQGMNQAKDIAEQHLAHAFGCNQCSAQARKLQKLEKKLRKAKARRKQALIVSQIPRIP